MQQDSEVLTCI